MYTRAGLLPIVAVSILRYGSGRESAPPSLSGVPSGGVPENTPLPIPEATLTKTGAPVTYSSTKMNLASHLVRYFTTFGPGMRFRPALSVTRVCKGM